MGLNRVLDEIQIIFGTVCGVKSCPGRDSNFFGDSVLG